MMDGASTNNEPTESVTEQNNATIGGSRRQKVPHRAGSGRETKNRVSQPMTTGKRSGQQIITSELTDDTDDDESNLPTSFLRGQLPSRRVSTASDLTNRSGDLTNLTITSETDTGNGTSSEESDGSHTSGEEETDGDGNVVTPISITPQRSHSDAVSSSDTTDTEDTGNTTNRNHVPMDTTTSGSDKTPSRPRQKSVLSDTPGYRSTKPIYQQPLANTTPFRLTATTPMNRDSIHNVSYIDELPPSPAAVSHISKRLRSPADGVMEDEQAIKRRKQTKRIIDDEEKQISSPIANNVLDDQHEDGNMSYDMDNGEVGWESPIRTSAKKNKPKNQPKQKPANKSRPSKKAVASDTSDEEQEEDYDDNEDNEDENFEDIPLSESAIESQEKEYDKDTTYANASSDDDASESEEDTIPIGCKLVGKYKLRGDAVRNRPTHFWKNEYMVRDRLYDYTANGNPIFAATIERKIEGPQMTIKEEKKTIERSRSKKLTTLEQLVVDNRGKFPVRDPEDPRVQRSMQIAMTKDMCAEQDFQFSTIDNSRVIPVTKPDLTMYHGLNNPPHRSGRIVIHPGCAKPSSSTKGTYSTFYLISGMVSVQINDNEFHMSPGGHWMVPASNTYRIKNRSSVKKAEIFYVVSKVGQGNHFTQSSVSEDPISYDK